MPLVQEVSWQLAGLQLTVGAARQAAGSGKLPVWQLVGADRWQLAARSRQLPVAGWVGGVVGNRIIYARGESAAAQDSAFSHPNPVPAVRLGGSKSNYLCWGLGGGGGKSYGAWGEGVSHLTDAGVWRRRHVKYHRAPEAFCMGKLRARTQWTYSWTVVNPH